MRQIQANPRAIRAVARTLCAIAALTLAAFAGAAQAQTPMPVYRFFNSQTGTHFYTINQAERDLVLAKYAQFLYEGPAYYAYQTSQAGSLPVYRFFNRSTGTHFYTQSEAEKNFVLAAYPVFAFEGPAYWAPASAGPGKVALYRFFNSNTGAHFFTTNVAERDMVLQRYPFFLYEGVAYEVLPTGGAAPVNNPPVTSVSVSPSTVPTVPAIVSITATSIDADGSVARVEFYVNDALVGTTYAAPHSMNYPLTVAGTYAFRAVGYDNLGMPGSSGTVSVVAGGTSNQLPVVTMSASPASLPAPGPITLTATAIDNDGTIIKVSFFENGGKIADVSAPPYTHTYNAATAKLYKFSATAYDDKGGSTSTPQVGVEVGSLVNKSPTITLAASPASLPAPGAITLNATAADEDGTVVKVTFYVNGNKIGEDTTAPYSTVYNAPSNAIYKFTATATDDKGANTTSADVNVSVGNATNIAPKVSMTVSDTTIDFPGTVTMTATATDDDGTIARVRFYQNGTQRAEITTPPYKFSYTTTVPGIYKFKATAYDNKGASTSTPEVDVTSGNAQQLNKKPSVSLSLSQTLVVAPATVTLTASASDSDGTIAKVRFYRNGTNIGEKTASPYTMTDVVNSTGQTRYRADAVDSVGNVSTTLDQIVTAAPAPPASLPRDADVWRLLNQATFGASQAGAADVAAKGGVNAWVDDQLAKPLVSGYPQSRYNRYQLRETDDCTTRDPLGQNYPSNSPQSTCVRDHLSLAMMQRDFFTSATYNQDQLRQRVAWALSQILVISGVESDLSRAYVMARYQQIMFEEAFGNFETILKRITLSPAMGNWLDSVNNDRPDVAKGRVPNENYAREINQLFSIGLIELKADGTPLLDALGEEIPSYDQDDIKQFARVFTGYTYPNPDGSPITKKNGVYYGADMGVYPGTATTGHDTDAKTLLDVTADGNANPTVLPAGQTPQKDIDDAVHNVFMHPNTGPFIGKQLIQKLVTGNPSPAYVQRVAAKFANNGSGVRGDLKAVVRAVLLDPEARGPAKADPAFGTLREPVLMFTGLVRALNGVTDGSALGDRAGALQQRPYYAPSVFNYFQPDSMVPGTSILAPEFGIYNSNAAVARTNQVYSLVYGGINPDGNLADAKGTRLNTMQFEPFATDAATLTDKVSEALLGAALPAAARNLVITAVNAITLSATPTAQQKTDRARMAVYLIASSNHFQIQR